MEDACAELLRARQYRFYELVLTGRRHAMKLHVLDATPVDLFNRERVLSDVASFEDHLFRHYQLALALCEYA